jgi:hypothetical protein
LHPDAFSPEFDVAVLNGEAAGTRIGFFTEIARVWRFPDYFGHNWDAVYDCLTDMSWSPAQGFVLVIDGFDHLATNQPEQWAIGLRDACAFWKSLTRPMYVLLVGPNDLAPGVSPLPAACFASRAPVDAH